MRKVGWGVDVIVRRVYVGVAVVPASENTSLWSRPYLQDLHNIIQLVFWPRFTSPRLGHNPRQAKRVEPLIYFSPWLSLSLLLLHFLSHFSRVTMTDGGQQNRVSGITPPINGRGLLDQALDCAEINISPFKIYQKRIFFFFFWEHRGCLHFPFHPTGNPPASPTLSPPCLATNTESDTL